MSKRRNSAEFSVVRLSAGCTAGSAGQSVFRDTGPQPSEYDSPRQPEKGSVLSNQHRLLGEDTRRRAVR
jgi:hypothetical protein